MTNEGEVSSIDGARALVRTLEMEGVRTIYGLPGEQTLALWRAIEESDIELVTMRHEQGAGFAAMLSGYVSDRVGVCAVTLGPGATNVLTPAATATLDRTGLLVLTARRGRPRYRHRAQHQAIEQTEMFGPVTKSSHNVEHACDLAWAIPASFDRARTSPPGATHLSLGPDVARDDVESVDAHPLTFRVPSGAPSQAVDAVARRLERADRPLLVLGLGARRHPGSAAAFVERSGIATVTTYAAKGTVNERQSLHFLGTLGPGQSPGVANALERADLVIAAGFDPVELEPEQLGLPPTATIVEIGLERGWVRASGDAGRESEDLWISAEPGPVFDALLERHASMSVERWALAEGDPWIDSLCSKDQLNTAMVVRALERASGEASGASVVCDVGVHKVWAARTFRATEPRQIFISNGLATMGVALPGAIGACLATDRRPTYALMGDGGFFLNVQELETAARLELPVTFLVLNDGAYGLIEAHFQADDIRPTGVRVEGQAAEIARGFGLQADVVTSPTALRDALAHEPTGPRLLEVCLDQEHNAELNRILLEPRYEHQRRETPSRTSKNG